MFAEANKTVRPRNCFQRWRAQMYLAELGACSPFSTVLMSGRYKLPRQFYHYFITSVLSNLRWFSFPHPTSKISRSEARQAWAVTPELQGCRQRVLQRAGSLDHRDWHAELSQGPCLSQSPDTDEDTPHTHLKPTHQPVPCVG